MDSEALIAEIRSCTQKVLQGSTEESLDQLIHYAEEKDIATTYLKTYQRSLADVILMHTNESAICCNWNAIEKIARFYTNMTLWPENHHTFCLSPVMVRFMELIEMIFKMYKGKDELRVMNPTIKILSRPMLHILQSDTHAVFVVEVLQKFPKVKTQLVQWEKDSEGVGSTQLAPLIAHKSSIYTPAEVKKMLDAERSTIKHEEHANGATDSTSDEEDSDEEVKEKKKKPVHDKDRPAPTECDNCQEKPIKREGLPARLMVTYCKRCHLKRFTCSSLCQKQDWTQYHKGCKKEKKIKKKDKKKKKKEETSDNDDEKGCDANTASQEESEEKHAIPKTNSSNWLANATQKVVSAFYTHPDPKVPKSNDQGNMNNNNASFTPMVSKAQIGKQQVFDWLASVESDMSRYMDAFVADGWDSLAALDHCTTDDLKEMSAIKKGHLRLLIPALEELHLKEKNTTVSAVNPQSHNDPVAKASGNGSDDDDEE